MSAVLEHPRVNDTRSPFVPPPDPEMVEVPSADLQILFEQNRESAAQGRDTLRQIADVRDHMSAQDRHMDRQDEHLLEQDVQRKLMWEKIDKIADAMTSLPKLNDRLAVIEKHAAGLVWASTFRQGLIWLGLLVVTGLVTAGAGIAVTWAWAHRHLGGS